MSSRATRPSPRSARTEAARTEAATTAPAATDTGGIVQQVLAERRELMIANERLRLELEELRGTKRREDPRLHVLELENRALREELAAAREDLAWFQDAVKRIAEEIEKASP